MSSQQEFLFFDTFCHDEEIDEVLQVDEIKFEQPVYIDEIRVVPHGFQANLIDKTLSRVGATKPSPCELEFFAKNLNARSNSDRVRYGKLGKKVFHGENDMTFYPSSSIPSDSLVIKGKYDSVTLAVIGVLARPKSPNDRHEAVNNKKQIVDFLQSALPPHRAHPMDTLPFDIPTAKPQQQQQQQQQQQHQPPQVQGTTAPSPHSDGVWVAPPEQLGNQQQIQRQPNQPNQTYQQRSMPQGYGSGIQMQNRRDDIIHPSIHEYPPPAPPAIPASLLYQRDNNPQSSSRPSQNSENYRITQQDDYARLPPQQQAMPPPPAPTFSSRNQNRSYSPSDYQQQQQRTENREREKLHERSDDIDEKLVPLSRVSRNNEHRGIHQDHINDDLNQLSNNNNPSFQSSAPFHMSPPNLSQKAVIESDQKGQFLHPSCLTNDNRRNGGDTSEVVTTITSEGILSEAESYESDDNTSESEASSIQGLLFSDDEHQQLKRDALYNPRAPLRLPHTPFQLKTFHSSVLSSYEVECEKCHHEKYRNANEDLVVRFRKILSHHSIDNCDLHLLESLESLCMILPVALACCDSIEETPSALQRLTEWTLKLIDLNYIMDKQFLDRKDTVLKIRLLKCGIRLCGQLTMLNEDFNNEWVKKDFQSKLLDLFDDNCMTPTVRLLIIKSLDQSLYFKSGLLWFIGRHPNFPANGESSCYFRLVQKLTMTDEAKRFSAAIGSLLTKIHLNEEFLSIRTHLKGLLSSFNIERYKEEIIEQPNINDETSNSTKEKLDHLLVSLTAICDILTNADDVLSQQKSRASPLQPSLSVVFSKIQNSENPWPSILKMIIDTDFLKSLTVLIHISVLNYRQDLFNCIEDILKQFMFTNDGLTFLANQTSLTNSLLRALFLAETKFSSTNAESLGPQVVCALQTLAFVDELKLYSLNDNLEVDDSNVIQVLHGTLSLIVFYHYIRKLSYKKIIVRVLALDNNMMAILKYLSLTGDEEQIEKLKSSVQVRYIGRILYELLSTPESILFLEHYGLQILDLCEQHTNQRLLRLRYWLQPLLKIKTFDSTQETIDAVMTELKCQINDTRTNELAPGLVTVLRIMKYLVVPPDSQFTIGAKVELKYDYMLAKFYSSGAYNILINILEKYSDSLLPTWQVGFPAPQPDRVIIYGAIIPALIILKVMLQKLILGRMAKFLDITPIKALFSVYTVTLCAAPSTELSDLDTIRSNLIDSFMAYTWSLPESSDTEDALNKSAWIIVLREILRLTKQSPYTLTSGICLLTELLPIPLPHTVRQPLSEHECSRILDDYSRFHNVYYCLIISESSNLQELIQFLCLSSNSVVQECLRRLCIQLIDLGAKLAKHIVKILLDVLLSLLKYDSEKQPIFTQDVSRLLMFIASITSSRASKCALLTLLHSNADEKYKILFQDLLSNLHTRSDIVTDICVGQEATLSIIQNLCEINLCLSYYKDDLLQTMANSLPQSTLLNQILINLIKLISSPRQIWTQTTLALRILITLCEHDYGLHRIKKALTGDNINSICTLISEFDLRFDKEQPDYLDAVSALMAFLRTLATTDIIPEYEMKNFTRKECLPLSMFRELLGVSLTSTVNDESHLEKFIELINAVVTDESAQNDEIKAVEDEDQQCLLSLQKIVERAKEIIKLLKTDIEAEETVVLAEPMSNEIKVQEEVDDEMNAVELPRPETLEQQFQKRLVYVIDQELTDDHRTTEQYWFGIPTILDDAEEVANDETDETQIQDKVKCDLEDLIGKYCGTFNFFDEYKKEVVDKVVKKRRTTKKRDEKEIIITTTATKSAPYKAPMRGSRFRRGVPYSGSQRRQDHFRSRPPNTSRPPSMHVDEFERQKDQNQNSMMMNEYGGGNNSGGGNQNGNNSGNGTNDNDQNGGQGSGSQKTEQMGSERDLRWQRRGVISSRASSNYRYSSFSPASIGYASSSFGSSLRDRQPYSHPSSRYGILDMESNYFGADEQIDDRAYDYFPLNIPFDPVRYRSHFSRNTYDSNLSGFPH